MVMTMAGPKLGLEIKSKVS